MLAIFSEKNSPRLDYVLELIFRDLLKLDFLLLHDRDEYLALDKPKLTYGANALSDEAFIAAGDLLFENGITEKQHKIRQYRETKVLFGLSNERSVFPFDPFAMVFYLVSRYEEYSRIYEPDAHGRRKAGDLIMNRLGVAERPVVNEIAYWIKEKLTGKYPELEFGRQKFSFTPTYDIDMAFAHKGKGFVRTLGGSAKILLKLDVRQFMQKASVLMGLSKDPYDNFRLQFKMHQELGFKAVYFVNLGDLSRYDKNVHWKNPSLNALLRKISENADIGIHPSYYSDADPQKIAVEKNRLEEIIQKPVTKSRQHFLKLDFPDTYRNLIKNGIEEDYSNGFHSQTGFRSGIAGPHFFYDLEEEKKTNLLVHPFAFMDTGMEDYMKLPPAEWKEYIKPMSCRVVNIKGHLMGIWHNYAMADSGEKKKAYIEILKWMKDCIDDQIC